MPFDRFPNVLLGFLQACTCRDATRQVRNISGPIVSFEPIQDVPEGAGSVPLKAKSDAGLPVEFFVVAGPAVVRDGRVAFTPIPPRTKFPVSVTVAAWQWGRGTEPKIKTADVVTRTFRILGRGAK